jgi:hypothetical protein
MRKYAKNPEPVFGREREGAFDSKASSCNILPPFFLTTILPLFPGW